MKRKLFTKDMVDPNSIDMPTTSNSSSCDVGKTLEVMKQQIFNLTFQLREKETENRILTSEKSIQQQTIGKLEEQLKKYEFAILELKSQNSKLDSDKIEYQNKSSEWKKAWGEECRKVIQLENSIQNKDFQNSSEISTFFTPNQSLDEPSTSAELLLSQLFGTQSRQEKVELPETQNFEPSLKNFHPINRTATDRQRNYALFVQVVHKHTPKDGIFYHPHQERGPFYFRYPDLADEAWVTIAVEYNEKCEPLFAIDIENKKNAAHQVKIRWRDIKKRALQKMQKVRFPENLIPQYWQVWDRFLSKLCAPLNYNDLKDIEYHQSKSGKRKKRKNAKTDATQKNGDIFQHGDFTNECKIDVKFEIPEDDEDDDIKPNSFY